MECFICFDPIGDDIFKGPCQHSFCMDCYYKLQKLECPMCRRKLKKDRHHPAWGRTLIGGEEQEQEQNYQYGELDSENMFGIPIEYIDGSYDGNNIYAWRQRRRKKRERNAKRRQDHRDIKRQQPRKLTRRQRKRQQQQIENRAGIYRRIRTH